MTNTREQLAALRKSAPAKTRLSVSRPARAKGLRSNVPIESKGNMAHYVQRALTDAKVIPSKPDKYKPADLATLRYATKRAESFRDRMGRAPYLSELVG